MRLSVLLFLCAACAWSRDVTRKGTDFTVEFEAKDGDLKIRDKYDTSACSSLRKSGEWNQYRAEVMGDSIKIWLNGQPCVTVRDPSSIAGKFSLPGRTRKYKVKDTGNHVWKPIWDGKTMTGWQTRGGGTWTIEDGALHGQSKPDDTRIGMVVSDASFADVTIRTRFKILKGNSGFFLRTDPKTLASYEVEIDAEKQTGGLWEVGGRNWVTGPADNAAVRKDEWNELTASLHGHDIAFFVNGVKTLDLANDTKGRTEGVVGLQAHGSRRPTDVWFKDIAVLVPESEARK